jgi:hypothetical protein
MTERAELQAAVRFVTARIEEQATRVGVPLTPEERSLLNQLPTTSTLPIVTYFDPEFGSALLPRDLPYERLCSLAKAARDNDVRENGKSTQNWDLAFSIAKLNRHPLAWLLQWAGVRQRPWWDRWLLVAVGLFAVGSGLGLTVIAAVRGWTTSQLVGVGLLYASILVGVYFGSRKVEEWELTQAAEKLRRESLF